MERKENLTNEKIRKRFVSQFELVNYAIRLASNMIQTGRDCRVKLDSQNRAMQIISEIYHEKDLFDEIIPQNEENHERQSLNGHNDDREGVALKVKERKKNRKLLAE